MLQIIYKSSTIFGPVFIFKKMTSYVQITYDIISFTRKNGTENYLAISKSSGNQIVLANFCF